MYCAETNFIIVDLEAEIIETNRPIYHEKTETIDGKAGNEKVTSSRPSQSNTNRSQSKTRDTNRPSQIASTETSSK